MMETLSTFLQPELPGLSWGGYVLVLIFEVPIYLVVLIAFFMALYERRKERLREEIFPSTPYAPKVTCLIACYAEGEEAAAAARTLVEQDYPGIIEVIPIVDGSIQNAHTLAALKKFELEMSKHPFRDRRKVLILGKTIRGGRVSSLNYGMNYATGEIILACDADTLFDNDMMKKATAHFRNPHVVAVSGNLLPLNHSDTVWTKLQTIEYAFSIGVVRTGLSYLNTINNVSGAFGLFRRKLVERIGAWSSGSAEDLDLTLRLKQYFGRHPDLQIAFEPHAIGYTEVPRTLKMFFMQRLRWDGDLAYLYFRKLWRGLTPQSMGWPNFIMICWMGLLHQVALPFLIIIYTCILVATDPKFAWSLFILNYIVYTSFTILMHLIHAFTISRNRALDLKLLPYTLLWFPFSFVYRIWSGISILSEIVLKAHLDSSMAPFWVLKRSKY
jgi:poly-beta-1,6-N-acetyl-D-glucosamine synthase